MSFMNGWRFSYPLPFLKSSVSFSFLSLSFLVWRYELCIAFGDLVHIYEVGLVEEGQWLRDSCLGHWERLYLTLRT